MSTRILQPTLLSLVVTGEGKNLVLSSTPQSLLLRYYYSALRSTVWIWRLNEIGNRSMPVTAAVVAHHRLRFYQHALPVSSSNNKSSAPCHPRTPTQHRPVRTDIGPSSIPMCQKRRGMSFFGLSSYNMGVNESLLISENDSRRFYSKGKDKVKSNKKVVVVNEEEMSELIDVRGLKEQLETVITHMKEDYTKQLNIRGAAGALETLDVEFEGEVYPLQELAQVGRKNPQLAVLNLASLPDACQAVMKAIHDSGMSLNPQQEGTTIFVPLPKVTREHRENLAKAAKVIFTKYKTSMQTVQNRYVKQCKTQKDVSEDLSFNVQQQIMKLTENYIYEANKLMQSKQSELLESN